MLRASEVNSEDIEASFEIVGSVIAEGDRTTKVAGLHLMAYLVGEFPPGDLRDMAEDILCTFIGEAKVSAEELGGIRRMRLRQATLG